MFNNNNLAKKMVFCFFRTEKGKSSITIFICENRGDVDSDNHNFDCCVSKDNRR